MSAQFILSIIIIYFLILLVIAWYTSRNSDNESFFIGAKKSNWLLVAYGMIGTSLSGVTFMSVPGEVAVMQFTYMQVVVGYFLGYIVVAYVLLPLYYRMNLTSIYTYLKGRLGITAYKTGASFFILSRTLGASIRIYLVLIVLQHLLLDQLGIPYPVTVFAVLLLILLYTFQGGVKTIVWTDTLQTTGMILSLLLTIYLIGSAMNLSFTELFSAISNKGYTQAFETGDWKSGNFFLKQILGGAFITITMTGLDQEMMQKNISVSNLRNSQKNMILFSVVLIFINLLFLILGASLYLYANNNGITLPAKTDETFSYIALNHLPPIAGLIFIIGLVSALFPSADGALTALTSSFCIDILGLKERNDLTEMQKANLRRRVHVIITVVFMLLIIAYQKVIEASVIYTILKVASYTYGPLLGLFAFGIFTKRIVNDNWQVVVVCMIAPIICWLLNEYAPGGYKFGIELLIVNGLITFLGLTVVSKAKHAV